MKPCHTKTANINKFMIPGKLVTRKIKFITFLRPYN